MVKLSSPCGASSLVQYGVCFCFCADYFYFGTEFIEVYFAVCLIVSVVEVRTTVCVK